MDARVSFAPGVSWVSPNPQITWEGARVVVWYQVRNDTDVSVLAR